MKKIITFFMILLLSTSLFACFSVNDTEVFEILENIEKNNRTLNKDKNEIYNTISGTLENKGTITEVRAYVYWFSDVNKKDLIAQNYTNLTIPIKETIDFSITTTINIDNETNYDTPYYYTLRCYDASSNDAFSYEHTNDTMNAIDNVKLDTKTILFTGDIINTSTRIIVKISARYYVNDIVIVYKDEYKQLTQGYIYKYRFELVIKNASLYFESNNNKYMKEIAITAEPEHQISIIIKI